jgi:hypothetical protein
MAVFSRQTYSLERWLATCAPHCPESVFAMKPTLTRLALALLPLFGAASVSAATVTWIGPSGGSWHNLNNWQNQALPTALDDVQLGSITTMIGDPAVAASVVGTGMLSIAGAGSLTLTGNSSLGGLAMAGERFVSSANVSITGLLSWIRGSIQGSGTTRVGGDSILDLSDGLFLQGHTLVLNGTSFAQTNAVSSNFVNKLHLVGARLVNEGTWRDQASRSTSFTNQNSQLVGLGNFDNAGTFTKERATFTTFERGVLFNNSGTVNVNTGTLRILGGGSSTGTFTVAEGATLAFGNSPTAYTLGATFINAGTLTIDGNVNAAQGLQLEGQVAVNAGNLSLGAASSLAKLSLNGFGAITQSSSIVVSGTLNWAGGFLNGTGSTRSTGMLELTGSGTKVLGLGHTLTTAGDTLQTGTGTLSLSATSRILNQGIWTEQASGSSSVIGGRFNNEGQFNKQSTFVTALGGDSQVFNNTGTVNVNAGTLRLTSSFNNQGLINVASGAELDGAHASFANAGTLAGTGTVRALDTLTNTGFLAPGGVGQTGTLQVLGNLATSGSLQIDLSRSSADLLAVSGNADLGGTLNFSVLSGQRLARGSNFTVMSWGNRTAGSEFASLDFSQASGYRFTTDYGATGLSVKVTGLPYTWTGAAAGGVWDVVNNWNDGGDGLPQAGDAVLLGSADTRLRTTQAVGDITGTGTLRLDGGSHLILSGTSTGRVGGLALLQGELSNQGRLVGSGESSWVGTLLRGSGGVTRMEGSLAIAGPNFDGTPTLLDNHTLEMAGTTTFTGRRGLSIGQGSRLVNEGTWLDQASANVNFGNFNGGANGVFVNQGTYIKSSAFTTEIGNGLKLNNTGTVKVEGGLLRISGADSRSTGHLDIASGAELSLSSNNFLLGGTVVNAGTLGMGGNVDLAGDLTVQGDGLTQIKAGINNNGAFRITGSVDWSESTLHGSGSTRIDGTVMLIGDRSRGVLGGQTVELAGTTRQVGTGGFSIGQGAVLRNLGTWLDEAPGNVGLGNFNGGATGRFDNVGTFTKTSAFVTEIGNGLPLNNTGTINIKAGTLRISGDASLTAGQIQIASGAMLELASGSIALKGTVQNAGTVALNGATVLVTDSATVQGGLTTLNSSTVNNTGRLVLSGNTDWIIATLTGSGNTRMEGALTLSGSNGRGLTGGHTLELAGSTTQTGTGSLNTGGGARVVNLGNWVEAANGNAHLGNFAGGALSRFDNKGSFTKTSAFITDIGNGLVLNNTGTIDIQAGTLRISQAFNNQGQLNVAAGAEVASTVVDFANAGILAGDGTVRMVNAFSSLSNTGILAAGGLNDAGTLSLLGGLTQQTGGIFLADLGSTAAGGFDVLTVSGAASLTGTLAVNLLAGAHFNVGDSFTVMTWNQRLGDSQFASLDLTQAGGYGFATEYGSNSLTLRVMTAPVPEPETWALMALGLFGLGACARRRSTQA